MKYLHKRLILTGCLLTSSLFCAKSVMYESNALAQLLRDEMRQPEYARDILPNNFAHVIQLLEYGTKTNQPRSYAQLVLRRFSNLLKASQYVNAHAAQQMLDQLSQALEPYISSHRYKNCLGDKPITEFELLDRFNTCVTYHLYKKFSAEYGQFKEDPGSFLDTLSLDIMHIAQEEISIEQLRQTTYRFMEIVLGKLVWSPEEGLATWRTVNGISDKLANLVEVNALDSIEDLDDLYRTLVYRYCYFVDLTSTFFDMEFYQTIQNDVKSNNLLIFETEDFDTCIETKAEVLQRTMFSAAAKRQAHIKQIMS